MSGFYEWIRRKLYKQPARGAMALAADASPGQIRGVIEDLRSRDRAYDAFKALLEFGERAAGEVEKALTRPGFRSVESLPHTGSPFENCLHLLAAWGRPRGRDLAIEAFESGDADRRRIGLQYCLAWGRAEAAVRTMPFVRQKATKETHEQDFLARSALVNGVNLAREFGRADEPFVQVVFPLLLEVIAIGKEETLGIFSECLLRLHRERAIRELSADAVLAVENGSAPWVMQALYEKGVSLPAERVLRLLEETQSRVEEFHPQCIAASGLRHLARLRHPEAGRWIERYVNCSNDDIAEAALDAMCILRGVHPWQFAVARMREVGFGGMTERQRRFVAVKILDGEVCNGGFMQYFANASGGQAVHALEGLREAGLAERAGILEAAIGMFGPPGVPAKRDTRLEVLGAILGEGDDPMSRLDSRWYGCKEPVRRRMVEYALRHVGEFGG